MSDQPVTLAVLAQFHRDVIVPDMHRVFEGLFERLIKPRFDQMDEHLDAIAHKLDKMLESASTRRSTQSDDHH